MIDVGSTIYGYTCTLNHPLRYMHIVCAIEGTEDLDTAFFGEDFTLDTEELLSHTKNIRFGIKCVGDFFELSSDCIKALQHTQNEVVKDLKILYHEYELGVTQEKLDSFNFLDEIVFKVGTADARNKAMQEGYVPVIAPTMYQAYRQFRELKLLPPKGLVQNLRSCIMGWTNGMSYFNHKWYGYLRYPQASFYNRVLPLFQLNSLNFDVTDDEGSFTGNGYRSRDYGRAFKFSLYLAFAYKICGIYEYNADTSKDEGGSSKRIRDLLRFYNIASTSGVFGHLPLTLQSIQAQYMVYYILNQITDSALVSMLSIEPTDNLSNILIYITDCADSRFKELFATLRGILGGIGSGLIGYRNKALIDTSLWRVEKSTIDPTELFTKTKAFLEEFAGMVPKFKQSCIDLKVKKQQAELERASRKRDESLAPFADLIKTASGTKADLLKYLCLKHKLGELQDSSQACIDTSKLEGYISGKEADVATDVLTQLFMFTEGKAFTVQEPSTGVLDTKFLVSYLWSHKKDIPSNSIAYKILVTLSKSKAQPSSKQLYYLTKAYKDLTGIDFNTNTNTTAPTTVNLSDNADMVTAINYVLDNDLVSNLHVGSADTYKIKSILETIRKYGRISEKQMKYAKEALSYYEANK